MTIILVTIYLFAIVAANLISAHWGAGASIYNAAGLIGLDMTTRDRLHDFWREHRFQKMGALIVTGSLLSYAATKLLATGPAHIIARIALASAVAFLASETIDAVVYHSMRHRHWLERINTSNVFSAIVDSVLFVTIAFGFKWPIIFGQICAKVFGGYIWALLIHRFSKNRGPVVVQVAREPQL